VIPADLLSHLERLTLVSRRRQASPLRGERRSRAIGSSPEFVEHRAYAVGDDLRRVDWNLYGRTNQLFVKQFEDERALPVHILVDVSRSMDFGEPNKLGFARQVGGALGYIGLSGSARVAVGLLGDGAELIFGPGVGRARGPALVAALDSVGPRSQTDLGRAVTAYTRRQPLGGLTVLISDLLSPTWSDAIRGLLGPGCEAVVLHVLAPEELDPAPAEEVRLVDRETGRTVDVRLDRPALDRYLRRLGDWCAAVEAFCSRSGARYQRLSTALPLSEVVLGHLARGGIVR
jgi:uncharacterized protein (DUF58 family)